MKAVHWIILGIVIAFATYFIYQTRETEARMDTLINLNWKFQMGDTEGAAGVQFDDSGWRFLSLPHDWMIEQEVQEKNPSGSAGGYYPGGVAWYRKNIDLTEYENFKQLYLLFEGVQMNADVYFNGSHLGKQEYGYSSFYHDISSLVRRDTINVISVRTDCSQLPMDRWYSGGGIYRNVRLIATSELHIPIWGQAVSSRIDDNGRAHIDISLEYRNNGRKDRRFEVKYDILDPSGKLVADGSSSIMVKSGSEGKNTRSFAIEDPGLWSPDSPLLYTIHCHLLDRNKKLDKVSIKHGIRSAKFDPDQGFVMNGEKMVLKGVILHHDGGELGAAVPLEVWERRLGLLKELGVNALRLAHHPYAPEMLDLCDRMGFLVIDEMYDKWAQNWRGSARDYDWEENWPVDLANFIRRDRNHPSVILWSLGNEVREQRIIPADGVALYKQLKDLVFSIDSTRMVTLALHPGDPGRFEEVPSSLMHVSPVVSYNYRSDSFRTWHSRYPDLVFIASETKGYGTQTEDTNRAKMEKFVAGQFISAGFDHLGQSAGWPDRGSRRGLLETNGFIKPHAWYIASRYKDDPLVKLTVKDSLQAEVPLVDHWSFEKDAATKEVVIFTNCDRVELSLNDSLLQTLARKDFSDGVIRASVEYKPGELVAEAYYIGERGRLQSVKDTLVTSYAPYALAMNSDRNSLKEAKEIIQITTSVIDSTGELNPGSKHLVNYQLEGPGRIRAIDNGDLSDTSRYGSPSGEVRKGKQLLILQAGSEPGDLIVSASAEGLRPSSVKIKSKDR